MTGRRVALTVFAAAAIVGAVAGALTARPVDATTSAALAVHPGAGTYLWCGWNGTCVEPNITAGVALDWDNTANSSIYWRSWAYAVPGGNYARGTIVDASGTCTETDVNLTSPAGVTYRGTAMYLHATSDVRGQTFVLTGSTFGTWYARYIGYTVNPEPDGNCPWDGEHVHQRAYWENVSSQSRNSLYPTATPTDPKAGSYPDITSQGKHQDYATWTY